MEKIRIYAAEKDLYEYDIFGIFGLSPIKNHGNCYYKDIYPNEVIDTYYEDWLPYEGTFYECEETDEEGNMLDDTKEYDIVYKEGKLISKIKL